MGMTVNSMNLLDKVILYPADAVVLNPEKEGTFNNAVLLEPHHPIEGLQAERFVYIYDGELPDEESVHALGLGLLCERYPIPDEEMEEFRRGRRIWNAALAADDPNVKQGLYDEYAKANVVGVFPLRAYEPEPYVMFDEQPDGSLVGTVRDRFEETADLKTTFAYRPL